MNTNILQNLEEGQSLSVAEFTEHALYDPEGYYMSRECIGTKGDFITAPEISQLFGDTLCIWAVSSWEKMGCPNKFKIIELGAGRGTLAADIIRASRAFPEFNDYFTFHILERSPLMIKLQKEKLENEKKVFWHSSIEEIEPSPVIITANEFLDALPINQYILIDGLWHEVYLTLRNGKFVKTYQKSDIQMEKISEKAIIEKNFQAESIIKNISLMIKQCSGVASFIDYGYTVPPLRSTIQSVKNHKKSYFTENIGSSDITAHVDFSSLSCIASEFVKASVISQKDFLTSFGICQRALMFRNSGKQNFENIMSGLHRLVKGMHLFKVLMLENYNYSE